MKPHLHHLWDKTVPSDKPCPLADPDAVLRRVNQALDGAASERRRTMKRTLKYALVAAAVLLFLGTAVAAVGLPDYSVLQNFYYTDPDSQLAQSLVDTEVRTVSDDNYSMSVTSSLSDGNSVYFTLIITAKTDLAREKLSQESFSVHYGLMPDNSNSDLTLHTSWLENSSGCSVEPYDSQTSSRTLTFDLAMGFGLWKTVSIRFHSMDEGIWLRFPVKTIRDVTVKINADGQGSGDHDHASGGPVTLEEITLSPISIKMTYTCDLYNSGCPVVFFLMNDDTIRTMGELRASGPSGSTSPDSNVKSWTFLNVQDISLMKAIIFENTAYPLDGSQSYPVDTSAVLYPFTIPRGCSEPLPEDSIPMSALCEGLGIPYHWDENTRTATMTFRDVTISITAGSNILLANDRPTEMDSAAVFLDGELWADAGPSLRTDWNLMLTRAYENFWKSQEAQRLQKESNSEPVPIAWVVTP